MAKCGPTRSICGMKDGLMNPFFQGYGTSSLQAPVNTSVPTFSGTLEIGETLTGSHGTWSNSPTSYLYKWQRDGVDIVGATSINYVVTSDDNEKTITFSELASNAAGPASAYAVSAGQLIGSDTLYPLTFGADLGLFINGRTSSGKTLAGPYNYRLDSLVSNDTNAYSFTEAASQTNEVAFSGKWLRGGARIQNADKAALKFLHDGSDFELFVDHYIFRVSNTTNAPFLQSNNATSAKIGFSMAYDNRSANSRTNALSIFITNGSAAVFNIAVNNALAVGAWNKIRIKMKTTAGTQTMTVWVNEVQISSTNRVNAPSASNSSDNLTLFGFSTTDSGAGTTMIRSLTAIKRELTAGEVTAMYDYLDEGNQTIGTGRTLDFDYGGGQSNFEGSPSTGLPAYLEGPTNIPIFANRDAIGKIEFLDYPLNNDRSLGTSGGVYGPELELWYRIGLLSPNRIVYKYGDGGTSMQVSWDPFTPGSTYSAMRSFMYPSTAKLPELIKYSLDATMRVKFFFWRQGEADANIANTETDPNAIEAYYKTNFTQIYKNFLFFKSQ